MVSGFENGDEVFISWRNDDENVKCGFFTLIELKDLYVILKTKNGTGLILPFSQILKIKNKGDKYEN